jgi:hypothetical protein
MLHWLEADDSSGWRHCLLQRCGVGHCAGVCGTCGLCGAILKLRDIRNSGGVIASVAKQSRTFADAEPPGSPRRLAPRDDGDHCARGHCACRAWHVMTLSERCTHLVDSGYVRLEQGNAVALCWMWPGLDRITLPGHAHADTLSFELSLFGQRVVVNSGHVAVRAGRGTPPPARGRRRITRLRWMALTRARCGAASVWRGGRGPSGWPFMTDWPFPPLSQRGVGGIYLRWQ